MLDLLDSRARMTRDVQALIAGAAVWQLPVPHDLARVESLADLIERLSA
jgi:hypothetical protein